MSTIIARGYGLHPQTETCIDRNGDGITTGHGEDGSAVELGWV